jgi:DMSO/TMAO reductase YedYZ molybdopterin-dependent catalytic subunit
MRSPRDVPLNAETPAEALEHEITPASAHFVRCHFPAPRLARDHRVVLAGAVASPVDFAVDELRVRPSRRLAITIECAGNGRSHLVPPVPGEPWRDGAVATAMWTGVPLVTLLREAGLGHAVIAVLCEGADGAFARMLPLDEALRDDVLVAYEMNDRPLPPIHGAPIRLVVPRWYGMASVKWLRRITAITTPFEGRFQTDSYVYRRDGVATPVTLMRPRALITSVRDATLHGFAWSGRAPIRAVLISVDGGPFRIDAHVSRTDDVARAWRRFTAPLGDLAPGRHTACARAVDERGDAQPDAPEWNELGYGANGVSTFTWRISAE